jgi:hypothetical protein
LIGSELLLAPAALLHPLFEPVLLRLDVLTHQSVALLYFFVRSLDHALYHYLRLRVEFVQLHPQVARVVRRIHFRGFGRCLFFLYEIESMWVGEERGEFFLEMVGLPRVFVDVILDGNLYGKSVTL